MVAFYQAIYFLNGCIFELNFIFLKLCFRYVSFVRLTVLTEKHFKTVEKHFRLSRSVQWTKFVHEVIFFSFGPEKQWYHWTNYTIFGFIFLTGISYAPFKNTKLSFQVFIDRWNSLYQVNAKRKLKQIREKKKQNDR